MYVGKYGPVTISYDNKELFYQHNGEAKFPLVPISENKFLIDGLNYYRLKFKKEEDKAFVLEGTYEGGRVESILRDE